MIYSFIYFKKTRSLKLILGITLKIKPLIWRHGSNFRSPRTWVVIDLVCFGGLALHIRPYLLSAMGRI